MNRARTNLLSGLVVFWCVSAVFAGDRPNVVFVLADDLGWAEPGCYGNGFNETPHLDALAAAGVRFTHAYAAAPVCSPYRAALLTGQYPARIGILDYLRPNSANALSTELVTLPELLQKSGYRTGMIGKWHLTGYDFHDAEYEVRPTAHGFGWNLGSEVKGVGNGANFWPYVFRKQPVPWIDLPTNRLGPDEYLTDRLNREAVDFIERNKNQPFFLLLSHYAPHTILNGRPDLVQKYRRKHPPGPSTRERCYLCEDQGRTGDALHHWAGDHNPHLAAMLESIDVGVGLIRAKLKELALEDNTIIIFSSDNGGETNVTSNAPLRGGKSQLYEGGIRVPLIVSWPGRTPAGQVCDHPTMNTDFYPTLVEATGSELDPAHAPDGRSTLALWKEPKVALQRGPLYWHYPLDQPHFLGGESSGAIRDGDWKLIEHFGSGRTELYSLAADPSEQHDVSEAHAETVSRLTKQLEEWRASVSARTPSPPLLTAPRQLYLSDHFSSGRASSRWFFNKDWTVENGVLTRVKAETGTTRLFLRDAEYADTMIRFDFRLGDSRDIRLVTGSGGPYNAVVHIRPDHFYIQTAQDKTGPWFSYRHGECAFDFAPDRWYSMTVEFLGDELVAHIDHEHLAWAKHPILAKTRDYFALQVDEHAASFDNVQIFTAARHRDDTESRKIIGRAVDANPVTKSPQEELEIRRTNAHEWFYQRNPDYVALVKHVDELDAENKKLYPEVFRTNKEIRKAITQQRKHLLETNPQFKELLFATYRAKRATEAFLISRQPEVENLPQSRRPREIEKLRLRHMNDPDYVALIKAHVAAQERLEQTYPHLFVSDDQLLRERKERRRALDQDPEFRERMSTRAAAWRARQEFLFEHDERLSELRAQLDKA